MSVIRRIESLFLSNLGNVLTSEMIRQAARDPITGIEPENWHQRLSELRTDKGYTILSNRDRRDLKPGEYLMLSAHKRATSGARVRPTAKTWRLVLERAGNSCEWSPCGLAEGAIDPVGGGTVRLTPDHMTPHSINPLSDTSDPNSWQALCGRHQVMKKNFWDSATGKMNVVAIMQAASKKEKKEVYEFLKGYFGA